ncbi:MAG: MerR family transcriptional regulator [Clostridiales bacterium]|jgi:flagellar operon protein (TIGR03826 family)|nr:MerR family transcriptional regulator [Clostridiales bacterium]
MEMAHCKRCKRLFARVLGPICDECNKAEEEIFHGVKEYLRDNPKSTVGEISEATGVSAKKIFGYLREGRLEVAEGAGLHCARCGIAIASGKLCEECFVIAQREISGIIAAAEPQPAAPEMPERQKAMMHTTRRRK